MPFLTAAAVHQRGGIGPRRTQRGLATLVAALVLLLAAAFGLLYSHRALLADQHLAALKTDVALAEERAGAGLEWAIGQLNSPQGIGPDCRPSDGSAQASFRRRYLASAWDADVPTTDVHPIAGVHPSCSIAPDGALDCQCPDPAAGPVPVQPRAHPGFAVQLLPVAGDPEAVQLAAWSCEPGSAACLPRAEPAGGQAARVWRGVRLKLATTPRAPMAALGCGRDCRVGGGAALSNPDAGSRGLLVVAGAAIDVAPAARLASLPGRPAAAALVPHDASLRESGAEKDAAADCSRSGLFQAHFGMDLARFASLPATQALRCSSAAECSAALDRAVARGWRWFDVQTELRLPADSTLGSRRDPLVLVARQGVRTEGRAEFNGLLVTGGPVSASGEAALAVRGALLSCGSLVLDAGTVRHDAALLRDARRAAAPLVRLPGTWRDQRAESDTLP